MSKSRSLIFLIAAFCLSGIVYSTTTPLFEAPDEQWHFAFVQHVAQGQGLPEQSLPLQHLARQEGSQPPLYYLAAAALTFWIDTSDFPNILWENPHYGYDVPGIVNDNKNLFIHTTEQGFPYHNTPLAMHLARLLSLAMGGLAVYFTYRITRLLLPTNEPAALAAASVVAFTPQFLYISSAVSNDSTIVALSAVALFLLVRAFRVSLTLRDALLLGIVCGLSALAKVSGLAMLPLAMLVLAYVNRHRVRQLVLAEIVLLLGATVVAGWWYVRNLQLYGELTGTTRMLEIFGARVNPLSLEAWRAQLYEVFETFWIGFGWGNIRAPEFVYTLVALAIVCGILGLVLGARRVRNQIRSAAQSHASLLVLGAWAAIVFVALLRWMMQTQAPHGRLFFPALPAVAPLLVFGWLQLTPLRARTYLLRIVPLGLGAFALAAPFLYLVPAYAPPQMLDASDIAAIPARVDIRYDDKLMLLGSKISPHPIDLRGALRVDLYWRVLAPMDTDYSLNLAALDENFHVVGSRNSFPGHGTLPTRLMTAGQIFHDTYWLPASAPIGSVQVSLFERKTQQNLTPYDPAGNEITPIVNRFQLAP